MPLSRRDLLRAIASGVVTACAPSPDSDTPNTDTDATKPDVALSKAPWVSLIGATSARLRFETLADVEVAVYVTTMSGTDRRMPTRASAQLTYENPVLIGDADPDLPGLHVLHELVLEDLTPGEVYAWSVPTVEQTFTGTFRAAPGVDKPVRIGWIADTMFPQTDATVAVLATQAPDLFLHGGDMQYADNPADTWQGFFHSLVPLTSIAPFHTALGNHEIEKEGELDQMFDRLFLGQGEASLERAHAIRVGCALILMLDSETYGLADDTQEQYDWIDAQLAAAEADDTVKAVILGWHRPLFTFSRYYDATALVQSVMLPKLAPYRKVRLALAGHAHSYEHFRWADIDWVVDGTAGALLYDPDESIYRATQEAPDLIAARLFVEREFGCTTVDVAPDGALTVRRLRADSGDEVYRFEIPALT